LLRVTGETATRREGPKCDNESGVRVDYDNCFSYVFVDHVTAQHAFLLAKAYYEGYDYEWIGDRTGQSTRLEGAPHFWPAGDRVVIVIEGGSNGGVEVWRCPDGKPVKGWDLEHRAAGAKLVVEYEFKSWDGEDRINLLAFGGIADGRGGLERKFERLPVRLIASPKWAIRGLPLADGQP
jgi:hypothetical protein